MRSANRARRSERGAVAGLEGVMFGVLVLLAGTVLVVNAWSVLQTRRTLDGAAREYLRAYTQADSPPEALLAANRALDAVLLGEGRRGPDVTVRGPDPTHFGPCASASVTLTATIPAVRMPFVGEMASTTVEVDHTELVDAHSEMVTGADYDPDGTPCAG